MRYWQEPLLRELAEGCERLAAVTAPIDAAAEAPWERLANQLNDTQLQQRAGSDRVDKIRLMLEEWRTTRDQEQASPTA